MKLGASAACPRTPIQTAMLPTLALLLVTAPPATPPATPPAEPPATEPPPPAATPETDAGHAEVEPLPDTPGERRTADRPDLGKVAASVVDRTNAFREEQGLDPVTPAEKLTATAQDFAHFMATEHRYGHGADGRTPAERVKAHDYRPCLTAENIAWAFDSFGFETDALAERFTAGWIESPGHRRNMLEPNATETGVAVARDDRSGKYFAVQLFARPGSAAVSFEVENRTYGPLTYRFAGRPFDLPARAVAGHSSCGDAAVRFAPESLGENVKEEDAVVRPADGQVLIVRAGDGGTISLELWSPPVGEVER